VDTNLFLLRVPARMFVVLGPLTLLMAVIGIHAVVGHAVSRRTTEIGVRLALGATGSRVVGQIVGEVMVMAGLGALAGWLAVMAVYTHLIRGGVDLLVFVAVPVGLLVAAAMAAWMPARRSASVDPVVALRAE
jgi:ABC-type antimicrobial peptide transport system permease subunit